MIPDEIAYIVHTCRKESGLSQQALAQLAGVGKTVVFDIEKGKKTVQLDTLLKVLETLNIKIKLTSPISRGKEKRLLLYIDILGTQAFTDNGNDKPLIDIIKYFTSNNRPFKLDLKNSTNPGEKGIFDLMALDPTISSFSDHIAISYPFPYIQPPWKTEKQSMQLFLPSLIQIAINLHKFCLGKEILIRGALIAEELLHEDNTIIGKALNVAVYLEEKVAIFPRIIIDKTTLKLIKDCDIDPISLDIRQDFDGIYFIDYLKNRFFTGFNTELLDTLSYVQSILEKNLAITDNPRDFSKWHWLSNKHTEALDFFYRKETNKKIKDELNKIKKFYSK